MRILLICLLLGACASAPPAAVPERRDCAPLPTLQPGAGRAEMLAHIQTTASLYAICAARKP